ncbi:uncharacterized protein LOC110845553 [Folsomia candida]|uniref:uncharacterized protein LOC110845553 n=1 Tax=Folsomia candida TaxID=158441 RepID=UPI00160525BE|nr:uncharacterized protein LOC110845553 [Folsomia candida]
MAANKNWRKVNQVFSIDQKDALFQKSNTLELISKLDLTQTRHGSDANQPIESLQALRPFLLYYRLFGFLPISIHAGNCSVWFNRRGSLTWVFTVIAILIQSTMLIRAALMFVEGLTSTTMNTASLEVANANSIIYFGHTLAMTLVMCHRVHLLPSFFESCKSVEKLCVQYEQKNDKLVRHCWILFGCFSCTQLVGNSLYYYSQVAKNNVTSIGKFAEINELQGEIYFNSSTLGVSYSFFEFYCDIGWTFGDTLIALMSLILTRFFIRLNKGISASKAQTVHEVERLRKDHRAIKDLVEQCNQVFAPIILVNFMGNVIYLLTRLYTGLFEDLQNPELIVRLESIYAFVYQIGKIMIPTWLAALLNETAAEAIDTVHDWPSLIELEETRNRMMVITRFISQLINDPVSLSGCGYFTITKSFLVTLISGLLTYEVIILQFQQSGL